MASLWPIWERALGAVIGRRRMLPDRVESKAQEPSPYRRLELEDSTAVIELILLDFVFSVEDE